MTIPASSVALDRVVCGGRGGDQGEKKVGEPGDHCGGAKEKQGIKKD